MNATLTTRKVYISTGSWWVALPEGDNWLFDEAAWNHAWYRARSETDVLAWIAAADAEATA